MSSPAVLQTNIDAFPCRRGKVRDVYDLGDTLAVVVSDRISAFDWVMTSGIPGKGVLLTKMTEFWFRWLDQHLPVKIPNHLISTDINDLPLPFRQQAEIFSGRTMLVKKAKVVPIECVARGYIVGSGWKEYVKSKTVCGIPLPAGLKEAEKLPAPIFTPATKAESGHDENISFDEMTKVVGVELAKELQQKTLAIYNAASEYAAKRGIILADTKFEFGQLPNGELIIIDEVLTPDSSRYWPKATYQPGSSPISFDKQFLRDWLETTPWDKNSPPPALPEEIIAKTASKYREAYELLAKS